MPSRWERLKETFSLDTRSLAVLRILLGIMLLLDLAVRAVDLSDHYTDAGVLPRAFQELQYFRGHPFRFSFHMMSGELPLQIALCVVAVVLAVALSLGFHTRLSLLGSLLLYISVQNRNTDIETGGDYLLRLVLFWCLFLPLGHRFSLDRRAGRIRLWPGQSDNRNLHFSPASVAVLLQMAVVYFFSAVHKDHPIWRKDFTAIHYALHIDAYDTLPGVWLREYPVLTALFTRATLVFEFLGPWFMFGAGLLSLLPGMQRAWEEQNGARTGVVIAFMLFHLGLGTFIALGTFPWFAFLIWFGFFPTAAWDNLGRFIARASGAEERNAIEGEGDEQEDGEEHDEGEGGVDQKEDGAKSIQEEEQEGGDEDADADSEDEDAEEGDDEEEEEPQPLAYPRWQVDLARRLDRLQTFVLAQERPIGKPRSGQAGKTEALVYWVAQSFAGFCAVVMVLWNLGTVDSSYFKVIRGSAFPTPDLTPLVDAARLDQHWGLFAPYPRTTDGYYVVRGRLADGTKIDLLGEDFELTWKKPDDVSGSYKTFRWRKYFRNLRRRSHGKQRGLYTQYACSRYNEQYGAENRLEDVTVYFMARTTLKKGGHRPTRKKEIARLRCPRSK